MISWTQLSRVTTDQCIFKCGITNQFPTIPVLIFWHFFENLVQFRMATGKTIFLAYKHGTRIALRVVKRLKT